MEQGVVYEDDEELRKALALSRQDIEVEDEEADLRRAIQLSMQGKTAFNLVEFYLLFYSVFKIVHPYFFLYAHSTCSSYVCFFLNNYISVLFTLVLLTCLDSWI